MSSSKKIFILFGVSFHSHYLPRISMNYEIPLQEFAIAEVFTINQLENILPFIKCYLVMAWKGFWSLKVCISLFHSDENFEDMSKEKVQYMYQYLCGRFKICWSPYFYRHTFYISVVGHVVNFKYLQKILLVVKNNTYDAFPE